MTRTSGPNHDTRPYPNATKPKRSKKPKKQKRWSTKAQRAGLLERSRSNIGTEDERREIAENMESCTPKKPCNSGGCSHCEIAHQQDALEQLRGLWPEGTNLMMVVLIFLHLHRPPRRLYTLKIASVKRYIQRTLEAAGCEHIPLWGYLDLSFNIHSDGEFEPHWAVHLQAVLPESYENELKRRLGPLLERDATCVKRPIRCDEIENFDRQSSYVCKPEPIRRTSFLAESRNARPTKQGLESTQLTEFLLWAGKMRPRDRQFLQNIREYQGQLRVLPKARLSSMKMDKRAD